MAINRVDEPTNPPETIGDWTQIIAMVNALMLGLELPIRVVGSNVVKGAVFQIGGTLYRADSATAISGTASPYVKLTPSGDGATVAASFVASLVSAGVAWDSTYSGWYDGDENAYLFDEGAAFTAEEIPAIMKNRDVTVPMGSGWLTALAVNLGSGWATALGTALGSDWSTAFGAATAGAGILARLLTVDGPGSGLNADLLDGKHLSLSTPDTGVYRDSSGSISGPFKITSQFIGAFTGGYLFTEITGYIITPGNSIHVNGYLAQAGYNGTVFSASWLEPTRVTFKVVGSDGTVYTLYAIEDSLTEFDAAFAL